MNRRRLRSTARPATGSATGSATGPATRSAARLAAGRAARLAAVVLAAAALAIAMGGGFTSGLTQTSEREPGTSPTPPPGSKLEIVAASADLLATTPGLLRSARSRLHNRIGTAARGAEFTLVSATEDYYEVRLECQEGKVRVDAWIDQKDAKPLVPGIPGEIERR